MLTDKKTERDVRFKKLESGFAFFKGTIPMITNLMDQQRVKDAANPKDPEFISLNR